MSVRAFLGIDLGTTTTMGAYRLSGDDRLDPGPHLVQVKQLDSRRQPCRDSVLPSVAVIRDGAVYVGQFAREAVFSGFPGQVAVRSVKRYMGCARRFRHRDAVFQPEQISSLYLKAVRQSAIDQLVEREVCGTRLHAEALLHSATITVPAAFQGPEREATREAARLAGFDEVRIIDEPTAALLYYLNAFEGVGDTAHALLLSDTPRTALVYDLGGGTLDVSICHIWRHPDTRRLGVRVLGRSPREDVGGDDLDLELARELLHQCCEEWGVTNLEQIPEAERNALGHRLIRLAEDAKVRINTLYQKQLQQGRSDEWLAERYQPIPPTQVSAERDTPDSLKMTVKQFRRCLDGYLVLRNGAGGKNVIRPIDQALKDAGRERGDVDFVFLAGGATRLVMVQEALRKWLGIDPERIFCGELQYAVARGAAHYQELMDADSPGLRPEFHDRLTEGLYVLDPTGSRIEPLIPQQAQVGVPHRIEFEALENAAFLRLVLLKGQNASDRIYQFPVPWSAGVPSSSRSPFLNLEHAILKGEKWSISATLQADQVFALEVTVPRTGSFPIHLSAADEGRYKALPLPPGYSLKMED